MGCMTHVDSMPDKPPTAKFPRVVARDYLAAGFGAAGAGAGVGA